MSDLSLSNVINIQVAQAGQGLGNYNTSNLAIFTHEAYDAAGFGSSGYKIYLDPSEVAEDFGSSSTTYSQALRVFSQRPNILANNGYLVIIPIVREEQLVAFSGVPTSGGFELNFDGNTTASIPFGAVAQDVEDALNLLAGLETAKVTGDFTLGFSVTFDGYYGAAALLTDSNNTLDDGGAVSITITEVVEGELIAAAISRTEELVQYFGLMGTTIYSETDLLAAAAVIEATQNKIGIFVGIDTADIEVGGKLDLLRSGSFNKSRGLFYTGVAADALNFQAGYASRGFSTNFAGSLTTQTMHLKDLASVRVDEGMTQTLLTKAKAAGADTYISLQGIAKVFTSGANRFFDQVYNQEWLTGALMIAGFNYLAQTSSKVPQTEEGMDGLKGAYRNVCELAVRNQYSAPGTWNSATTFGDLGNFINNIDEVGYYIYSTPVGLQSQADREDRIAPVIQIAIKEAGAIHSSTVVVYINA